MGWTQPQNWTAVPFSVSNLNTQIRDNFIALKDPPSAVYNVDESSDLALASTSWADVDGTSGKFNLSITTNGGDVMVGLHVTGAVTAALVIYLDIMVDGVAIGGNEGIIGKFIGAAATVVDGEIGFFRIIEGLAAGSHIFKLRYKVSTSTFTLFRGAGTASADMVGQFWVREIS